MSSFFEDDQLKTFQNIIRSDTMTEYEAKRHFLHIIHTAMNGESGETITTVVKDAGAVFCQFYPTAAKNLIRNFATVAAELKEHFKKNKEKKSKKIRVQVSPTGSLLRA